MTPGPIKALNAENFPQHAAMLRPETRMSIDGELVEAGSSKRFEMVNPATGEVIAKVPLGEREPTCARRLRPLASTS